MAWERDDDVSHQMGNRPNKPLPMDHNLRSFAERGSIRAGIMTGEEPQFIDNDPSPQDKDYWDFGSMDDSWASESDTGTKEDDLPFANSLSEYGKHRFEELPGELRNRIYGFMLPTEPSKVTSKRDGDNVANGVTIATYKPVVHLKGFSVMVNKEWLSVLRPHLQEALSEKGVEIWTKAPTIRLTSFAHFDDEHCIPEDRRSPYHKDSVRYAKSMPGMHFALAADIMRAKNDAYPWSGFSFDMGRIDHCASIAMDLVTANRVGPSVHQPCLSQDNLRQFIEALMVGLSVSRTITLHYNVESYSDTWDHLSFMDFVHDLRYVADNGLINVTVCLYDRTVFGWHDRLRGMGGPAIKWVVKNAAHWNGVADEG